MSIITDALKKAERERELKAKQVFEAPRFVMHEEAKAVDVLLNQADVVEAELEKNVPFASPSLGQFREILVLGAVTLFCLAVLFLLPVWPAVGHNLALTWSSFHRGGIFQVGAGGNIQEPRVSTAQPSDWVRGGVKLPFVLSGVSVQGSDRYAIVNGTIVQTGDSIDGAHVKEISDREVTLETKVGEIKLKIQP